MGVGVGLRALTVKNDVLKRTITDDLQVDIKEGDAELYYVETFPASWSNFCCRSGQPSSFFIVVSSAFVKVTLAIWHTFRSRLDTYGELPEGGGIIATWHHFGRRFPEYPSKARYKRVQ